jgi:predicted lipoprotein with Yx(FWY)xxD motif
MINPEDSVGRIGPASFRSGQGRRWLVLSSLLAAASVTVPTLAGASPAKPVVTTARIPGLGTVLVARHRPLYVFTQDPVGRSTCTGSCATVWPPLLVSGTSAHRIGHLRGLGTIHRQSGRIQVTFHGHPLYFFARDTTLKSSSGEGFQGLWFAVRPNGTEVSPSGSPSAPTSAVPSTPSTPSPAPGGGGAGPRPTSPPPTSPPPTSPPPTSPPPTSPPPTSPPPTSPPPTSPPPTSPPPTSPPPPPTTTTAPPGGGVSF